MDLRQSGKQDPGLNLDTRVWRWLDTGALPGPETMALDEALIRSFQEAPSLPVFRYYGWKGPWISLGRFQDVGQGFHPERLEADGVGLVRRMTGGGAIFHHREVTYSLVCRQGDLGAAGVKDSFRILCSFLLGCYRELGWPAAFAQDVAGGESPDLGRKTPVCYAGKELFDIVIEGRKLGGNAQRRVRHTIFQHGSIPLADDLSLLKRYFDSRLVPDPAEVWDLCALSAPAAAPDRETLGRLFREHFSRILGITWEMSEPTAREKAWQERLLEEKYKNPEWTLKGREVLEW